MERDEDADARRAWWREPEARVGVVAVGVMVLMNALLSRGGWMPLAGEGGFLSDLFAFLLPNLVVTIASAVLTGAVVVALARRYLLPALTAETCGATTADARSAGEATPSEESG